MRDAGDRSHADSLTALRAIDVQALQAPAGQPDVVIDELPTCLVTLPPTDPARVAVLSWRWDIDPETGTSRNVGVALRHAKSAGITRLLMDRISIDQSLPGDELLAAVVSLASRYSSLPVIAAYDEVGIEEWLPTMRRPWICFEARSYRANPTSVTYVGHVTGQGSERDFGFLHMLERLWDSTYTHSILMVLCDQVGMMTVSDFRLIMHEHAEILSVAYASMSRNDYLLTTAILSQAVASDVRVNADLDPCPLGYERYAFVDAPGGSYDSNQDILLDGRKVAAWLSHYNAYKDFHRKKLEIAPQAEETIFEALGLPPQAYDRFRARERQRRATMLLDERRPKPELQVILEGT